MNMNVEFDINPESIQFFDYTEYSYVSCEFTATIRPDFKTPTMAACRTMCMIPQTYIATVPDALQFALSLWVSAEPACKLPDAKKAAEIELKFCAELTDRIKGLRQHIIVAETENDGVLWACNAITKAQLSFSDVQGGELDYLMPCDEYFDHAKETAIRADNSFPDNVELSVYEFLPRYTYYEG